MFEEKPNVTDCLLNVRKGQSNQKNQSIEHRRSQSICMELVEPLLLTISNVKELVQSHAEISNEVSDLGKPKPQSRNGKLLEMDCPTRFQFASYPNHFCFKGETILLIESAIKPLNSSGNDDPHLKDVLRALQLRCLPLAFLSYSQPSHFALLRLAYQHGQCQDRLGEGGHGHDHLAASYVMVHSPTTFLHGPCFMLLLCFFLAFSLHSGRAGFGQAPI